MAPVRGDGGIEMSNQPINDGGSAFPSPPSQHSNGFYSTGEGMTLRDYFAAKAINEVGWYENMDNSAAMAYLIADSMLKARGCK
jgi:hypothetical protein